MSTLQQYRDIYVSASLKAGDISRQLGYAGVALIWLFKNQTSPASESFALPQELYLPAALILSSLGMDLLQYVFKSAIWGFLQRRIENKYSTDNSKEYLVAGWVNWPSLGLFWLKLLTMISAYALLLQFLFVHVNFIFSKPEKQVLYQGNSKNSKDKIQVVIFNSVEGKSKNKADCLGLKNILMQRSTVPVLFWCEDQFQK